VLPAEQDRPDVARRRQRWKKYQGRIDPRRLVFIDETWTKTNMAPLRGWCQRGRRLPGKVPHGHWQTMTFIAALRVDRIDAPCVFDGPINGESFRAYVDQILVPTLAPGDIVVIDNLGSHKSQAVRAHRAGVLQAESPAAHGPGAHRRGCLAPHRQPVDRLPAARVRQLLHKRWICFNLK
jgi:hypothetical protein